MSAMIKAADGALNEQEREFISLALVHPLDVAYEIAGYPTDSPKWRMKVATLTRKPAVLAALHLAMGRQLQLDAVAARHVALQIMNDTKVAAKVRADLAVKIIRMGGYVEPKQAERDTTSDKSLAELSMAELRERAEALERELSDRAKPVISIKSSATDDDATDMFE